MRMKMPVNKGRVGLLVAALRSGEYTQGQGSLHRFEPQGEGVVKETWCCLGVAADIADKFGCPLVRKKEYTLEYFGEAHSSSYLPSEVAEWYGFPNDHSRDNPRLQRPDGTLTDAVTMNDTGLPTGDGYRKVGFDVIADAFERTYMKDDDNASE
jgi:hypothetical protein